MELNIKSRKSGESIRSYVYDVLSENITNLQLKPGACISEKEIAEVLSVSRTPVREAFIQLSQEELVQTYPQKGTYVSLIDLDLVEESRFMRETLESAVAYLAAQSFPSELLFHLDSNLNMQKFCIAEQNYKEMMKYDTQFHHILFQGTHKERVFDSIQKIGAQFLRLRTLRLADTPISVWESTLKEHENILNAIKQHEKEKAREYMEIHLTHVIDYKKGLKEKYPNYFK